MSKSLSHIFLPAFGGVALIGAVAVAFANRDYAGSTIDTLEMRVDQVAAQASAASAEAESKAAMVGALEAQVAEVSAKAEMLAANAGSLTEPAPASAGRLGLGREAHVEEIAAWDVDILPDGRGLPEGRGDVYTGEEVFAEQCASCHGDFAEGVDNWPVLAGGFDTLGDKDPVKTVGSYWPYLSTVWDYVNRSMPFGAAQTLSDDEVYAIVAYILYSNDIVDDEFELSHENFTEVAMYNADGFIIDDRAEVEYGIWSGEPCMSDCKDSVEITMRASILDVTPDEGGDEAMAEDHAAAVVPEATSETGTVEMAAVDPALVTAGEKVFKKCSTCHQIGDGAKNRTGPLLTGLMGQGFAGVDGFKYSNVFKSAAEEGRVWDDATLAEFLANPRKSMKGTRMSFAGLKNEADIEAVIAYIRSFDG